MNAKLLLLFLFVAVAFASPVQQSNNVKIEEIEDPEDAWRQFVVKFNKSYKTPEEETKRKGIFMEHYKMIREHNKQYKQNLVSSSKAIYEFADMTAADFARTHTGVNTVPL
ncbi:unnamed protein product [Phyllotreta striolata]|uniref:Cathepsin propeptide inhibitor domain-containing protein n=1 Tax=Phyllotreta striolata TaxID=444603 RepID=A0A9N9THH7_PHYSR|nr:unnamed protein product [Phyllotreta striolata]